MRTFFDSWLLWPQPETICEKTYYKTYVSQRLNQTCKNISKEEMSELNKSEGSDEDVQKCFPQENDVSPEQAMERVQTHSNH